MLRLRSMSVFKLPTPKKGQEGYIIAGDWHSFYLHQKSFDSLLKVSKLYNIKNLIINGDFLDAEFLRVQDATTKKWINRPEGVDDYFIPKANEEIRWGNDIFDILQKYFKNIYFIEGNHDWRYHNIKSFLSPKFQSEFDLKSRLFFKKRKIKYIFYNDWLDIGHLSITHGMYHGTSACKRHYEACGGNVIFSHVHQEEVKSFVRRGSTVQSRSLPAMCELNPEYLKNRETQWTNGFGSFWMKSDGTFNFYYFTLWNEELVLPCGRKI